MSNVQRLVTSQFDVEKQEGVSIAKGIRYRAKQSQMVEDCVMDEHPVALVYNGLSHVVMMVTPVDLENFAVGFSLSEGIISGRHELYDLDILQNTSGTEVKMTISTRAFAELKSKKEHWRVVQVVDYAELKVCNNWTLTFQRLTIVINQSGFNLFRLH